MNNVTLENKIENFFLRFTSLKYKKNEIIIRGGDIPQGVFFLKSGYVRVYTLSIEGKELTLNIFKPGSYFPLNWVFSNYPNYYYFEAMTPVTLYRANPENVQVFLKENSDVTYELTQRILSGLQGMMARIEHLMFGNAQTRIVSVLLMVTSRFGIRDKNGQVKISIKLTHQEIANMAGISRETATKEISELKKMKLIDQDKRFLVILDHKQLEEELIEKFLSRSTFSYTF
ncbi:hypothetical protein A2X44_05425 [candidate division CPR3 bacterium GWF2_35_18]|uniref:CRP/FNR family transcriptional regulator n=1 Tax=candidate division CPR3 bacterium GW2011_GWF2_35_18 TaxID=1618350 RepID=A0A0G0BI25_UNCC3|nr:MAG: CRP/FNR family transcriptional regulator [candidate division CPR3 bacterium GW2011_GWF2_35_18]KKP85281.1 MAG: CRP/FNR family transcriptional regulator [candidate division CPR3 bacterium GW2011_GWE2_35_7]OGB63840.1 MAG: hypothetical protein A2X44_05425 [candidate division CPR3 bacterium GWF2_35_18]OGB65227.1 MAG: hypothetical protein A2250_03175 [candidate division CPR3 bacterium RIFOXYA2_FULL_35_13]OGB77099.1 MAG: hypothetical protein A2476_02535 [candidate division CPR3 bacterium RIFOX